MKLDIGNGKILGTKRVSPNGQVSGFSEYAGRDVLVVLPGDDTDFETTARDVVEEMRAAAQQYMQVAFRESRALKERFKGPNEAAKEFLDATTPRSFKGLYEKMQAWAKEQAAEAEERLDRARSRAHSRSNPDQPTEESA